MPAPVAPTAVTVLPTPPTVADPTTFDARADATLVAQQAMVPQVNSSNSTTYDNAVIAYNSATSATASASAASVSEIAAAASAVSAATAAASLTANSSTSNTIGTGNLTFTILAGKQFAAGQFLLAVSSANTANYVYGQVVSYVGTTIVIGVTDIGGSGTKTDWVISVAGIKGAVGVAASTLSQTLTDGATINWDSSTGRIGTVTLAGNRTIALPTNCVADTYILYVNQDATGSRTLTWNAGFKWAGGAAPILSTTANAKDVFSFICDGTNFYGSYLRGVV